MRVMIRADGNKEIAMGHVMRCLSIADALRDAGACVCFVTAGNETQEMIRGRGYDNIVLNSRYDCLEEELPLFLRLIREQRPQIILADSYFVTERYLEAIGNYAFTAYIDDMATTLYPVDVLINYNIYGNDMGYEERYEKKGGKLPVRFLLGCSYAPLRKEFQGREAIQNRRQVHNVLITTGGGDVCRTAAKLCFRIAAGKSRGEHKGIRYQVVCGPFSDSREELQRLAEKDGDFVIHENVTQMSELMAQCDLAVTAGGSTMYELCCMGVPSVCFYFAENQRRQVEYFDRLTGVKNAGNMALEEESVLGRLVGRLEELEESWELRNEIRNQMLELTDGRGAERIARELLAGR